MGKFLQRTKLRSGISLPALMLVSGVLGLTGTANAQSANDAEVRALRAQVEALQKAVNQLTAGQQQSTADAKAAKQQADEAKAKAAQAASDASKAQAKAQATANANAALAPAAKAAASAGELDSEGHRFFEKKKGNPLTFYTPGGEITAYGNIDVSVDAVSKSVTPLANLNENNSHPGPIGNFAVLPALSTNSSYLGVRGFQRVPTLPLNFVYQLELGFDVTATPGTRQTNSSYTQEVNGALFNRNTWVGFANPEFGAIKIGKTTAPYQDATGGFNPFSGQIGDYRSIVGNSGGDNRVEFGTRLDHSIWYESPKIAGFQWNFLFSPGQNRSDISDNIASAESSCTGGNDPGSLGNLPVACNDGAFGNAVSTSLNYTNGPFYATVAYERHFKVNRQSDIFGLYGATATGVPGLGTSASILTNANNCNLLTTGVGSNSVFQRLCNEDVADEDAFKVGALYTFPTKTTIGGIFETLHRYVAPELQFQNERQRNDTWFFVTQQVTENDSVSFGWAHAFKTVGDPGQHNPQLTNIPIPGTVTADGAFGPTNNNQADLLTATYKRKFGPNLTWYTAVAATINGPNGHYDLGAGGHANTTDCHDAFAASGGIAGQPICFTGTTLAGFSTGLQWRF
jgi:predicted porin